MLEGSPEQSWGEYHKGVHDVTVAFLEAQKPVKPDTHGGEGNARKMEGREKEREEEREGGRRGGRKGMCRALYVHLMSFMGRRIARNWYIGSSSRHRATRLTDRRMKSNLMNSTMSKVRT